MRPYDFPYGSSQCRWPAWYERSKVKITVEKWTNWKWNCELPTESSTPNTCNNIPAIINFAPLWFTLCSDTTTTIPRSHGCLLAYLLSMTSTQLTTAIACRYNITFWTTCSNPSSLFIEECKHWILPVRNRFWISVRRTCTFWPKMVIFWIFENAFGRAFTLLIQNWNWLLLLSVCLDHRPCRR